MPCRSIIGNCSMSDAELIDRLCAVINILSEIIREQRNIISQASLVYDDARSRDAADELGKIEFALGRQL